MMGIDDADFASESPPLESDLDTTIDMSPHAFLQINESVSTNLILPMNFLSPAAVIPRPLLILPLHSLNFHMMFGMPFLLTPNVP